MRDMDSHALEHLSPAQRDRLGEVLDAYLTQLEAGEPADAEQLIRDNADLAAPLRVYLRSLNELQSIAAGFVHSSRSQRPDVDAATEVTRIGDFLLGSEIGRGGMGVVYDARQISLDRRVALKVLPFAAVLDSQQIARFKNEAQAAAQLQHEHIVPVFAVGAERGVHYYAMPRIDGQPLDRVIRDLRRLSGLPTGSEWTREEHLESSSTILPVSDRASRTQQVIRWGIDAADALHTAHEDGVIHRDVKPSNFIIDHSGKIWITDFGLARCQKHATLTRTGDVVGTRRYMSPEQMEGQLVDHRTDVYSLALTLVELLTLEPVHCEHETQAARGVDVFGQPFRRAQRLLAGQPRGLQTVLLKGLASQRDQRYESALDFAEDLARVRDGQPPRAKRVGWVDRVAHWSRSHKQACAVATAVCLLAVIGLAIGTVLIAREKARAETNFQRAEKQRLQAQQAVDRFGTQLAEKLANIDGAERLRHEVLHQTLQYYQAFVREAEDDARLQDELGLVYSRMANLLDQLQWRRKAVEHHEMAIATFDKLTRRFPDRHEYQRQLALCHNNLAMTLRRAGDSAEAAAHYHRAVQMQTRLLGHPNGAYHAQFISDLALSYSNWGLLDAEQGHFDSAVTSLQSAIRLQQQLLSEADGGDAVAESHRRLASTFNDLSAVYVGRDAPAAEQCYRTALEHFQAAAKLEPTELDGKRHWALTYNNYASLKSRGADVADADRLYGKAIALQQELVTERPRNKTFRCDLAVSLNNRGLLLWRSGDLPAAEDSFREATDLQRPLLTQYPSDLNLQSTSGGVANNLAMVLEERGQFEAAAAAYRDAIQRQRIAYSQAPGHPQYREYLSKHYFNYGRVLRQLGYTELAAKSALARRELWSDMPERLPSVARELRQIAEVAQQQAAPTISAQRCRELAAETLQLCETKPVSVQGARP